MSCEDCAKAAEQTWWGAYRARCAGCSARAVARSLDAFNALHPDGSGDVDRLAELIGRAIPNTPPLLAMQMVLEWWQRDHPQPPIA